MYYLCETIEIMFNLNSVATKAVYKAPIRELIN